ncbi:MAG: undecaprenyl-diphosphate phosphatase [Pirellulaceae bacterium]|nr:undecaprenyl-diphosphate phosphatase [Pirellulaceae bacterium]
MIHLQILLMAVLQGITEFLPVSSSGHLVVLASIFDQFFEKMDDKLTVNIVLHLGTLAAIGVFYWRRILALLGRDRRVIGLLIVGSIPAAAIGVPMKLWFDDLLESPLLAGFMFLVTGAMLAWAGRCKPGETDCRDLSYARALAIGLFQAFALLPGVSRSGSTIVAGIGAGLKREEAATFSFLLAIPALGGAGLLETVKLFKNAGSSTPFDALALGLAASFIVGLAALAWLIRWLEKGKLHYFAWWLFLLGPAVIAWQIWLRV